MLHHRGEQCSEMSPTISPPLWSNMNKATNNDELINQYVKLDEQLNKINATFHGIPFCLLTLPVNLGHLSLKEYNLTHFSKSLITNILEAYIRNFVATYAPFFHKEEGCLLMTFNPDEGPLFFGFDEDGYSFDIPISSETPMPREILEETIQACTISKFTEDGVTKHLSDVIWHIMTTSEDFNNEIDKLFMMLTSRYTEISFLCEESRIYQSYNTYNYVNH